MNKVPFFHHLNMILLSYYHNYFWRYIYIYISLFLIHGSSRLVLATITLHTQITSTVSRFNIGYFILECNIQQNRPSFIYFFTLRMMSLGDVQPESFPVSFTPITCEYNIHTYSNCKGITKINKRQTAVSLSNWWNNHRQLGQWKIHREIAIPAVDEEGGGGGGRGGIPDKWSQSQTLDE